MAASASDAHPYCIYGARFRLILPLIDNDGDLVASGAGLDTELSQDCGTFADGTNEATEIATSSGMYYLDLIATETDCKIVAGIVKTSTTDAKTSPFVIPTVRLPVIRTGTAQAGGASSITLDASASAIDDYYIGCYVNITNNSPANALGQARMITAYNGSTKVATVEGTYGTNPSSASTFEILATERWIYRFGDIKAYGGTAGTFSSGRPEVNATHAAGTAWNSGAIGASTLASDTITAAKIAADAITAAKIADGAIDSATFAAGAINAAAIAADAITDAKVASDVTIASVTGAVGSVTAAVTVGTNNDKTGYRLSATGVDDIWDEVQSGHSTAGTFGLFLDTTISSRGTSTLTQTQVTGGAYALNSASFAFNAALPLTTQQKADVNTEADTALSDVGVTTTVTGRIDAAVSSRMATFTLPTNFSALAITAGGAVTAGTVSDKTGYSLATTPPTAAAIADAVWDEAQSGHVSAGTFGLYLDSKVSEAGGGGLTAGAIADAVWDEATSGHQTAGTTGAALTSASSAGDPWTTALPGAYAAGTAGAIIGTTIPGLLVDADITLSSPVSADGETVTIRRGDDYLQAIATQIAFTFSGLGFSISGATVTFRVNNGDSFTMTVTSSTAAYLERTAVQTDAMTSGNYTYEIDAVLSGGQKRTLATGTLVVQNQV